MHVVGRCLESDKLFQFREKPFLLLFERSEKLRGHYCAVAGSER